MIFLVFKVDLGCSCVPDYGQLLLKNKFDNFDQIKKFVVEGNEIFKHWIY